MRPTRLWIGALGFALLAAACSRKPASIDISPKKVKIYGIERSTRLTARVLDRKGQALDNVSPSWSSSNASIVAAEAGGRLVSKKEGKATVSATVEGAQAQIPVEVVDVGTVEISTPQLTLIGPPGTSVPLSFHVKNSKGETVSLPVVWSSQNPKVATASEDGRVTSVGAGTTTVVGKVGDVQGGADVTVKLHDIVRLELHPATALVRVGDSQHFTVTAFGADGIPIPEVAASFQSSNAGVASVSPNGVATGHKAGAAAIRAELAGVTAEATLLVN